MRGFEFSAHTEPNEQPNVWTQINQYNKDEQSKQFTTLQIGIGNAKLLIYFTGDDGDEVQRVAYQLRNKLTDAVEQMN